MMDTARIWMLSDLRHSGAIDTLQDAMRLTIRVWACRSQRKGHLGGDAASPVRLAESCAQCCPTARVPNSQSSPEGTTLQVQGGHGAEALDSRVKRSRQAPPLPRPNSG